MRYLLAFMLILSLLVGCVINREPAEVLNVNEEVTQCGNMINGGRVLQGPDDKYYYQIYDEQSNTLTLMEYSDEDTRPIINGIGFCYFFLDGWVYCAYGPKLAFTRVNVTTGEKDLLLDETCLEAIAYNGKVYFTTLPDPKLYAMDLDGENIDQVGNDPQVSNLMVSGGKLYCYILNEGIYSFHTDGSLDLEFSCDAIQMFYILNDAAYYLHSDGRQLYMYSLGSENAKPTLIDDRYIYDLNVRDHELIYIALTDGSQAKTFSYDIESGEIVCLSDHGYDGVYIADHMIFEYVSDHGIYCIEKDVYLST